MKQSPVPKLQCEYELDLTGCLPIVQEIYGGICLREGVRVTPSRGLVHLLPHSASRVSLDGSSQTVMCASTTESSKMQVQIQWVWAGARRC